MELNTQEVPQAHFMLLQGLGTFLAGWGAASGTHGAPRQAAAGRRLVSALAPWLGALGQLPPQSLTW